MSAPVAHASLSQWLEYLETLHPVAIDMGLSRVQAVAGSLNIKLDSTVITVAGTNGKGSVCAMLEAMVLAGGYRVGCYTSPHLVHYNERIRIDGEPVDDAHIIEQFERIDAARGDISLTYFEFGTLAALLLFAQTDLDVVILEVGLGGRLDAVNIIDADCAVITSIDIDHRDWLGDSREEIALEKAHIFRPGRPAICADPQPPQTLVDHAQAIGADLWRFGRDFNYSGDRLQWAYGGREQRRSALAYPALRGANQLLNASAALAALETLRDRIVLPQHAIRLGLSHAALPGRFQIMPGQPMVILDVAHNPHAAAALSQNLANIPSTGKTSAIVGMFGDKDVRGVLQHMIYHVDHWLCVDLPGPRGLPATALAGIIRELHADVQVRTAEGDRPRLFYEAEELLQPIGSPEFDPVTPDGPGVRPVARSLGARLEISVHCLPDPVSAYNQAIGQAGVNDRILVFGSFATVGPVLERLGQRD
ncbi:MAG: bifunctional tetrahydrofolate synthase/dihydrofolate synthase [Castellaniella sp.]